MTTTALDEQLQFDIPVPDGFDYEFWKQTLGAIAAHDQKEGPAAISDLQKRLEETRRVAGLNTRSRWYKEVQWAYGDLLLQGEAGGVKAKQLQEDAVRITGYQWGTLKNLKSIAAEFPASRRRDGLTWSHHVLCAPLSEENQDRLLKVAREKNLSVRELSERIKNKHQTGKALPTKALAELPDIDGFQPKGLDRLENPVTLKMSLHSKQLLNQIADAKGFLGAEQALWWMVTEYWKQNKQTLEAQIAEFEANRKKIMLQRLKEVDDEFPDVDGR